MPNTRLLYTNNLVIETWRPEPKKTRVVWVKNEKCVMFIEEVERVAIPIIVHFLLEEVHFGGIINRGFSGFMSLDVVRHV